MFKVKKECALLAFLKEKTGLSGKAIKRALEQGACRVNGIIERFASAQLAIGDSILFSLPKKLSIETHKVLYEDEDLTIYNKPSGITTEGRYLVHRLDKGTSGTLLIAKKPSVQKKLELLFKKREVKKRYIALITGSFRKEQGTIENKLGVIGSFHGQNLWGETPKGDTAVTHWKVLKKGKSMSLLELIPHTGRTHQLRVHMSSKGHPILGDLQYGRTVAFPEEVNRLCLHAYQLSFTHPILGVKVEVTAPIPQLFKALIGTS